MDNFTASKSGTIKVGDIVSFKGLWEAEVRTVNNCVITVIGNEGLFIDDCFEKKEEFTNENLVRIYKMFNVIAVTNKVIQMRFKLYKSDKFPVEVHRTILVALKGYFGEIKYVHDECLALVEAKIGKIY